MRIQQRQSANGFAGNKEQILVTPLHRTEKDSSFLSPVSLLADVTICKLRAPLPTETVLLGRLLQVVQLQFFMAR
jgi:hypothetical protein